MKPNFSHFLGFVAALTIPLLSPAAASVASSDLTVNVGAGKTVVFSVPSTWKIVPLEVEVPLDGPGKTMELRPKDEPANGACSLTLIVVPDEHMADHAVLKDALVTSGAQIVDDSVEGKVNPVEFKTPHAFGYSAVLTDKKLVGKPSKPQDFKVVAIVLLYLPTRVVVTATIFCDDVKGPEFAAMTALLRSLDSQSKADSI